MYTMQLYTTHEYKIYVNYEIKFVWRLNLVMKIEKAR